MHGGDMEQALDWLKSNLGNILLVIVVVVLAFVVTKVLRKIIIGVMERANIPSASIFVNIMRVAVWFVALTSVLQPVFGINPTSLITAMGIGGVALSLGMQDTVSNVIGGFTLMIGKVIQPGDRVRIGGTTGVVKDITWRQTVVLERGGNEMVIPNSVLNASSLERLTESSEGCASVPFTVSAGNDLKQVERQVLDLVDEATEGMRQEGAPTTVKFTGFTPYGISGEVQIYVKFEVYPTTATDAAARALAGAGFIEQHAAQTATSAPELTDSPAHD